MIINVVLICSKRASSDIGAKMTDESQGGPVPFGFPEDWPRIGVHQSVAGCTLELGSFMGATNRRNAPVILWWLVEKEDQSYRL